MALHFARIRSIAKPFNSIVLKFAGSSHSPFAAIRHVGRRSGKAYETPLVIRPVTNSFVIAMPYGPEVDWHRNMAAAGRATLLWHGREYIIERPELIDSKRALPLFPLVPRLILGRLHVEDFILVQVKAIRRRARRSAQ